MKFSCDTASFGEAVSVIGRVVSPHSTVPALEGIMIHASYDTISMFGYGTDIGISTSFPANIEEDGDIVLTAKVLQEIARRLPGEIMSIRSDKKLITEIVSGAAEYKLVGIDNDEFPEFPPMENCTKMPINQGVLASMIGQTLYAISTSDAKPVHTGSLFEADGRTLRVVSVDGYRLAMRQETVLSPKELRFVVPGKALSEVQRILSPEGEDSAEIFVAKKHVFFKVGSYVVYSRLLEGEFLDYRSAIPKESKIHIRVSTRSLIESVDRVSLLISDRIRSPLRVKFDRDEIRITCSTALGRAADSLPCENDGEAIEMGFNNRYLLDALRNAECDEVMLEITNPLSPMRVVPPQGESFLFLVLPVRLKAEE